MDEAVKGVDKIAGEMLSTLPPEKRKEIIAEADIEFLMDSGFTGEQALAIATLFSKCVRRIGNLEI